MYQSKKNSTISYNQLRLKLLYNNTFSHKDNLSINLNTNLYKLKSFNDSILLEGLLLLEFFTSLKVQISYHKRIFQQVNVQIANSIRKGYTFYFITLLKLFYFPILYRRNLYFNKDKLSGFNFNFTLKEVNVFPFLPDIYFK